MIAIRKAIPASTVLMLVGCVSLTDIQILDPIVSEMRSGEHRIVGMCIYDELMTTYAVPTMTPLLIERPDLSVTRVAIQGFTPLAMHPPEYIAEISVAQMDAETVRIDIRTRVTTLGRRPILKDEGIGAMDTCAPV